MNFENVFTKEKLLEIFPASKTDDFFDALYGEAESGAYDIELAYRGASGSTLNFSFFLNQRNNACLACNLTYGLPQVFMRHPIINLQNVVKSIAQSIGKEDVSFELGRTIEESTQRHCIPLTISIA